MAEASPASGRLRFVHILAGKPDPDSMNGVNKVVHYLANEQARKGVRTEVWSLSSSARVRSLPRDYQLRRFDRTLSRFRLNRELIEAIARLDGPIWIQLHSVFVPEFPSIAKCLRRIGLPYGLTPHGGYSRASLMTRRWIKAMYMALFESRLLRHASLIHVCAEGEVGDVRRLAPDSEIAVVPNGVVLGLLADPGPRAEPGPIFGFCGRLASRHKGLDLLIAAFGMYKAKGGSGVLWLIGGGSDRENLERQARQAGVFGSVRFLGEAYGEERDRRLRTIDVFVHTSRWEGLPLSCLEAAALAKPLLITKETNLGPEVTRSGAGWVLPDSSSATIAEALRNCEFAAREGELRKRGELARRMAQETFSWSLTAARLTCLWQGRAGRGLEPVPNRDGISLAGPRQ